MRAKPPPAKPSNPKRPPRWPEEAAVGGLDFFERGGPAGQFHGKEKTSVNDLILVADTPNDKWLEGFETFVDEINDVADTIKCAQALVDETDDWREAMSLQKSVDDLNEMFVETVGPILDELARVLRPKLAS
jgi:hypothetical protein